MESIYKIHSKNIIVATIGVFLMLLVLIVLLLVLN